jgi:hypothetical protein
MLKLLTDFSDVFENIENGLSQTDMSILGVSFVPFREHVQQKSDSSMANGACCIAFCRQTQSL